MQKQVIIGLLILDKKTMAYLPFWSTYPTFPFQMKQPVGQGFKLKFLLWFKLFFFFLLAIYMSLKIVTDQFYHQILYKYLSQLILWLIQLEKAMCHKKLCTFSC